MPTHVSGLESLDLGNWHIIAHMLLEVVAG